MRRPVSDPPTFGRVAVLMGGWGAEREVSLWSGEGVHEALAPAAIVGCGAGGVLGAGREIEGGTAVTVWAATFERPVITQDYGVLGRSVRGVGLGLAVDTSDPVALAMALESAIAGDGQVKFDVDRARQFAAHRDGDDFSKQVLGLDDAESIILRNEKTLAARSSITA